MTSYQLREITSGLTVLYVEDEADIRRMYAEFMKPYFKSTDLASNGVEAWDMYQAKRYDIVISDVIMPKMDGLKLIKLIRGHNPDQPVIVTSANDESGMLIELINLGIDKFFLKPFKLERFTEVMGKVCKEIMLSKEVEIINRQQIKSRATEEILGSIAHHWRQPLNNISLILQDLMDLQQFEELDEEYFRTRCRNAIDESRHLSQTINLFGNIILPEAATEQFELVETMDQTLYLLQYVFELNHIVIRHEKPDQLFSIAGPLREFEQSIVHILINAKDKFMQDQMSESCITIRYEMEPSKVNLLIEDNGSPFDEALKESLFDAYFSTKNIQTGSGLGLFYTRHVIQNRMGGEISLNNTEAGVCCKITLPIRQEA